MRATKNRQQFNARAGQKKTHVFFGNARPKSNARAHLKQKKNIVALDIEDYSTDARNKILRRKVSQ